MAMHRGTAWFQASQRRGATTNLFSSEWSIGIGFTYSQWGLYELTLNSMFIVKVLNLWLQLSLNPVPNARNRGSSTNWTPVRPMGLLPFFLNPVHKSRNRGSSTNRNPQKTCHVFSCHDIPALPLRQQFPMPIDQFYIYLPQSYPNETFAPQVAFRAASGGVVTLAANLGCQEPRTSRMSSQAERSGHPGWWKHLEALNCRWSRAIPSLEACHQQSRWWNSHAP